MGSQHIDANHRSICSSVVSRSINSWTGTLPLGSRKYSIRQSTTVTVQDIYCYLKRTKSIALRFAAGSEVNKNVLP